MKQNQSTRRLGQLAREKLANILLFEISDPDLSFVTLTGVEVSVDRGVCRAYVSCEASRYGEVSSAFERAHGRLRALLGHALGWRVTPELIFEIDTTADDAERIQAALLEVPPTLGVEKDEQGYPLAPNEAPRGATTDEGES